MGALCVRMMHVMAAKRDDFLIAMNCRLVIFMTMMAEQSFHEPCFSMVRINVENLFEKNFRDLPSFLGNCPSCMTSVDADHGVILVGIVEAWRSKYSYV